MFDALKKYAQFSGRATRQEFWLFMLLYFIANIIATVIDIVAFPVLIASVQPAGIIVSLALIIPGIAVTVRRLHDIDKSGWWCLLGFIPIIGWIILLVWHCTKGTEGANRFGDDPLGGASGNSLPEGISKFDILTKYIKFSGRATRKEYWSFILPALIICVVTTFIHSTLYFVVWLILVVPWLAVTVRRLHDIDKSGWWYLIVLIPVIGTIFGFIWFCTKGSYGTNRFGDDPLQ